MALLSASDQERLRRDFAAMTRRVRLLFFTQTFECETCEPTRQILQELTTLTDYVVIEEVNLVLNRARAEAVGIAEVPAVAILVDDADGTSRDTRMRFLGMPAGYEFASLLRAVLLAGGGSSQLSEASRARLAAVDRPVTVRVFTTPTCPHCPSAVNLALEMACATPHVTAFAVEVTEFPELARRYRVTGVPKTVVDDGAEILGALPEQAFVEQALAGFGPAAVDGGSE